MSHRKTAVRPGPRIAVRWALGISTTTSATNRLMLLVAKQMEYLSREVLRIQRKAGHELVGAESSK